MAETAKTPNYTPEQENAMRTMYVDEQQNVAVIAEALGKSVRSVTAKLVRMGVYKKKEYVSKTGAKPVKKDAILDDLGEILVNAGFGMTEAELSSLAGANKTALQKLVAALKDGDE